MAILAPMSKQLSLRKNLKRQNPSSEKTLHKILDIYLKVPLNRWLPESPGYSNHHSHGFNALTPRSSPAIKNWSITAMYIMIICWTTLQRYQVRQRIMPCVSTGLLELHLNSIKSSTTEEVRACLTKLLTLGHPLFRIDFS